MGFLDNSGDIILDAVLTDTGRMRLAAGEFNITHYAFGDDEINYALYRNSNHAGGAHPSGSAYYDLSILQTPILEAFTDNTANLRSRLVTYTDLTHIYLPILKLNEAFDSSARNTDTAQANAKFVIAVDEETASNFDASTGTKGIYKSNIGIMKGTDPSEEANSIIRIDQGLDTVSPSPAMVIAESLKEWEYTVEMDNRLGFLWARGSQRNVSYVDDDDIASYKLTSDGGVVRNNTNTKTLDKATNQVIKGPRGTYTWFRIGASVELQDSNDLFEKIGVLNTNWVDTTGTAIVHYIDSVIRIRGNTTGYKIDIPIRYVKLASSR